MDIITIVFLIQVNWVTRLKRREELRNELYY